MTEDEARQLATHIIDTWPNSAKAYIWRDVLIPLDHDAANTAYRDLRTSTTNAPSPGTFTNAYRAIRQRTTQTEIPNTNPDEALIGPDHPRAIAAFQRGLAEGRRELAAIRARQQR